MTAALFYIHNTSLPTLYTLLKTHKILPEVDISTKTLEELKVRPIISCSGAPIERLAMLVTRIITSLLRFILCHLGNIHQHLQLLRDIEPSSLEGLKFYTADVSALFMNVNVEICIGYVLELAEQHWEEVETYGLKLVDLHRLLEVVMGNPFSRFKGRLYVQIYGTFTGCSTSPPCAIITVYWLEKESIYADPYYLQRTIRLFYVRYVDDSGSLARSKEEAKTNCYMTSSKDSDGKIKREVEYPEHDNQYVPFLDTEILILLLIHDNGAISSRYYRKPRNKGITLNYRSHHQTGTKIAVAKNYYKTAKVVWSGPAELKHSLNIVDSVLSQNGCPNPRSYSSLVERSGKIRPETYISTLTLLYTTEKDANRIRNYVRSNELPIRLVFTPGKTLKNMFCKSRPYDMSTCVLGNPDRCVICPIITNGTCNKRGVVYELLCKLCSMGNVKYQGEADRPAYYRLQEHIHAASNPLSYANNRTM